MRRFEYTYATVLPAWMPALLVLMGFCTTILPGCVQATPELPSHDPAAHAPSQATVPATPLEAPTHHADGGPDSTAIELRPDAWQGSWRLVAADDPHEQALMTLSIQGSTGETRGSGGYALHQPFCDALANVPIRGDADCEFTGLGGRFDQVEASPAHLLLTFHPTADGMPHRLELRHEGGRLLGEYAFDANDIHRPVVAEPAPVQ